MSKQVVYQNKESESDYRKLFQQGIIAGIGWAIGVTIGFVLISSIFVFVLKSLGGVPIIGAWTADIVEATLEQLEKRSIIFSQ